MATHAQAYPVKPGMMNGIKKFATDNAYRSQYVAMLGSLGVTRQVWWLCEWPGQERIILYWEGPDDVLAKFAKLNSSIAVLCKQTQQQGASGPPDWNPPPPDSHYVKIFEWP